MAAINISPLSQIQTRSGILTTTGTILQVNPNRNAIIIQNLSTAPLFVCFGAGASATVFDFVLKPGAVLNDGTGDRYTSGTFVYTGLLSVFSTTPQFTVTEM